MFCFLMCCQDDFIFKLALTEPARQIQSGHMEDTSSRRGRRRHPTLGLCVSSSFVPPPSLVLRWLQRGAGDDQNF